MHVGKVVKEIYVVEIQVYKRRCRQKKGWDEAVNELTERKGLNFKDGVRIAI